MDRTDAAILAALQNDGRLSNKELAGRIGLAPSSCLERVRALRAAGVLRGVHAAVDPAAMGIGLQALFFVTLARPGRQVVEAFREAALRLPEVRAVYLIAGPHDFLVHVAVRDADHLRDLGLDAFTARPEVAKIETALIFDHAQRFDLPNYAVAG